MKLRNIVWANKKLSTHIGHVYVDERGVVEINDKELIEAMTNAGFKPVFEAKASFEPKVEAKPEPVKVEPVKVEAPVKVEVKMAKSIKGNKR